MEEMTLADLIIETASKLPKDKDPPVQSFSSNRNAIRDVLQLGDKATNADWESLSSYLEDNKGKDIHHVYISDPEQLELIDLLSKCTSLVQRVLPNLLPILTFHRALRKALHLIMQLDNFEDLIPSIIPLSRLISEECFVELLDKVFCSAKGEKEVCVMGLLRNVHYCKINLLHSLLQLSSEAVQPLCNTLTNLLSSGGLSSSDISLLLNFTNCLLDSQSYYFLSERSCDESIKKLYELVVESILLIESGRNLNMAIEANENKHVAAEYLIEILEFS